MKMFRGMGMEMNNYKQMDLVFHEEVFDQETAGNSFQEEKFDFNKFFSLQLSRNTSKTTIPWLFWGIVFLF